MSGLGVSPKVIQYPYITQKDLAKVCVSPFIVEKHSVHKNIVSTSAQNHICAHNKYLYSIDKLRHIASVKDFYSKELHLFKITMV